jgi:type IV pilus assembly protein PilV
MIARNQPNNRFGGQAGGFTLLEVMVALIITSIGLLGIAKIHALAYSSTATAGTRSLVALQAAGLAASMHGNRTFWAANTATIVVTDLHITAPAAMDATASAGLCETAVGAAPTTCAPDVMAAYDLQTYAAQLHSSLQNSNVVTTIKCSTVVLPINCTIQVTWNEKAVALNSQSKVTDQQTFAPTYTLYVEP